MSEGWSNNTEGPTTKLLVGGDGEESEASRAQVLGGGVNMEI